MAIAQAAERTTWRVVIIIFVLGPIDFYHDQNNIGHYDRNDGYCHIDVYCDDDHIGEWRL